MQPIIGFDFGNFNSFTCFILDFDTNTRMSGMVYDLLPPRLDEGIPSVYFYSKRVGESLVGENAVRPRAVPVQNRLRYLKRHLGETITLDDRQISYDDAIVEVIQHCIRSANKKLSAGWQVTTNLVSLSYPATYTFAQRQRLIELVERATLEDNTKVKVFGTIAEPAAAALDYLAEFAKSDKDTTVLTYDLGGGTFDLGLVSVYPKGRKNRENKTYYYDIINTRGIANLGGAEFDEVLFQLLSSKLEKEIGTPLNATHITSIRSVVETTKVELSTSEEEIVQVLVDGDYVDLPITREEFETASKTLLMKTISKTRELLQDHQNQKPEVILLTGGASQMPMVQRELEKAFPEYKGKIVYFRPSRAIAYGAARFGTAEWSEELDVKNAGTGVVQQRVMYDIGIRYFHGKDDIDGHIRTFIKAGTETPCESAIISSTKVAPGRYTTFKVYEAIVQNPDSNKPDRDYTQILFVTVDHKKEVPKSHPSESKISVDAVGKLVVEARDTSKKNLPFEKAETKLNLG